MKIIAFVGMPASGKSEASRIAAEMGIPVIIMGDVIRKEVLSALFVIPDIWKSWCPSGKDGCSRRAGSDR